MLQDAEQRSSARVGLSLVRLSDKKVLYNYNSYDSFVPASVVKILSTGASLDRLGRRYRYATDVYVVGEIKADTLHGSLLIKGSGDPSLASSLLDGEAYRFSNGLRQALRERGIKSISGSIYIDASLPTQLGAISSWEKEDITKPYGTGLYGLNYRDNRLGERANSNPAQSFAQDLEQSLSYAGISLGKSPIVSYDGYETEGVLLYSHYSQNLEQLAQTTNHRSVNLFAEGIGRILEPEQERGIALSRYWQKRLNLNSSQLSLADGSGLSRANRLSAHALAQALVVLFGGEKPEDGLLLQSLPRLGYEGTLRILMPYTNLQAYLKSGTMRRVCTYAGYVYYGGEWYALAYLTNDFKSAREARGVLSALLEEVFPTPNYNS